MFFTSYQGTGGFTLNPIISSTELAQLSKPKQEMLFSRINEFKDSEVRKEMLKAQDYYKNKGDILEKKRYYLDRMGIQKEATTLANSKLLHPYLRKLTRQKVNYLLSKELSIQSDDKKFLEIIGNIFTSTFLQMLKNVGKHSIINGIAWVQAYYNELGELKFKRIPTEEIIPFWADIDHMVLEGIIRHYTILRYMPDGSQKQIIKVEYYTEQGVWYFVMGDKGLEPDPDKPDAIEGNFKVLMPRVAEDGKEVMDAAGQQVHDEISFLWDKIPFIPFKYNEDEIPLLRMVKTLIDDYDRNVSDTSDTIQDIPNAIKVVKNYDGQDKEEFTQNLNLFRTAFVSGDGDMKAVETKLDITAIDSHLDRLRKDIYEAGAGVDTQEKDLGNASGVALKFRYSDLDMDSNDMASEFRASLDLLIWFIKTDLMSKGEGDYMETAYDIIFNTDMITNESEVITDVKNSTGLISEETIIANHPWVTDVEEEMARLKKQKEAAMKEFQEMNPEQGAYGKAPTTNKKPVEPKAKAGE